MFRLLSKLSLLAFLLTARLSAQDAQPHVVIVVGTHHYVPHLTLPAFAESLQEFGFRTTLVMGEGDPEKKTENVLPGIDALADADMAIFFLRFLQLQDEEWQPIQDYIESGKPVIGLRTTSHAFRYPADHPRFPWNQDFGRRVLGTPYIVHLSSPTKATVVDTHRDHPILTHVDDAPWTSAGKLYLTHLEPGCVPLVLGSGTGRARLIESQFGTFQVNESDKDIVAWTWENEWGAKVFATSFGHPEDFAEKRFVRMLINGICWGTDQPLPGSEASIPTWNVSMPKKKTKTK